MRSNLLLKHGLINYISGSEYNISYKREGDKVRLYLDNILKSMDISPKAVYSSNQSHTNIVRYCNGLNGEDYILGKFFDESDGLITDKKDIALLIKFADCTPIVLFDPIEKIQASLHSGWRGTVNKISENAINMMVNEFNCKKKNIIAYIGPSIDMENYEVGQDVYDAFSNFENRSSFFRPKGEKYLLSMVDANLDILLNNGISKDNIEVCRISTFNDKSLNSARRDKENYKLNSIVTMIK